MNYCGNFHFMLRVFCFLLFIELTVELLPSAVLVYASGLVGIDIDVAFGER